MELLMCNVSSINHSYFEKGSVLVSSIVFELVFIRYLFDMPNSFYVSWHLKKILEKN